MDIFDKAQNATAQLNEQALRIHQAANKQIGIGSDICLECGETIPEERKKLMPNCVLCVTCLTAYEKGEA